jgi:sulfhydrogenase subunit beta (sulfur reductase)
MVDPMTGMSHRVLNADGIQALLDLLKDRGFRVLGPTVRDQAIVYGDIASVADLPQGWTDEQQAGRYRLKRRPDNSLFGFAVGPHSWKQFLHPPIQRLFHAERTTDGMRVTPEPPPAERFAFIGVRACELQAIAIQDKVFLAGAYQDPHYRARREGAFLVAVNCAVAGGTCFCASMNSGPEVKSGFDLSLTSCRTGRRMIRTSSVPSL